MSVRYVAAVSGLPLIVSYIRNVVATSNSFLVRRSIAPSGISMDRLTTKFHLLQSSICFLYHLLAVTLRQFVQQRTALTIRFRRSSVFYRRVIFKPPRRRSHAGGGQMAQQIRSALRPGRARRAVLETRMVFQMGIQRARSIGKCLA